MGGALEIRNKKLRCTKCQDLRRILLKPVLPEPKLEILCHCHNVNEKLMDYFNDLKKVQNFKYICHACKVKGIKHPKFCYQCLQIYCEKCSVGHGPVAAKVKQSRPSLRGHKTIFIEKLDFFCINHQNEKYIGFCLSCKLNICQKCISEGVHQEHPSKLYKDLELSKEKMKQIKANVKQADKKNQDTYKKIKNFLSKNKDIENYQKISDDNKLIFDSNNYILDLVNYSYNLYDGKPKNYSIIYNLIKNTNFDNTELNLDKDSSPEEKEEKIMEYLEKNGFILKQSRRDTEMLEINNKLDDDEEDDGEEYEEGEYEEEEDEKESDNNVIQTKTMKSNFSEEESKNNKICYDDEEENENEIIEDNSQKIKYSIKEKKEEEKVNIISNKPKKKPVSIFDDTEESPPPSPKRNNSYKSDDSWDNSPKKESIPHKSPKIEKSPESKKSESPKKEESPKEIKIPPPKIIPKPTPPPPKPTAPPPKPIPPPPKPKVEEKKNTLTNLNINEEEKKKEKKEPPKPVKRDLPKYGKEDSGYKSNQPNKIHLPSIYVKKKEDLKERKNIISTGASVNVLDKKNFIHQMMINTGFTFGKRKTPAEIKQEKIEHEVHEAGRVSEVFKKAPVVKKKKKKPKKKFSE